MDPRIIESFLPHTEAAEKWVEHRFRLQRADAEDVVRDVVVSLLRRPPPDVRSPRAYLFAACARRAWQFLRMRRKRSGARPPEPARRREEPESWPHDFDFGRFTPAQRQIVSLVAAGYTRAEAARRLGIASATARWRLHQLRKSLGGSAA